MIRIIDDWGLNADPGSNCYVIGRIRTQYDKRAGAEKEYLADASYLNDITQALHWLYKRLRRDAIESTDGDLKAAIQAIQASDRRLEDAIRAAGLEGK